MLCLLTVHLLGCFPRLHPLTQPSQCAHWHRRPDMQIHSPHWCFPEKRKKKKKKKKPNRALFCHSTAPSCGVSAAVLQQSPHLLREKERESKFQGAAALLKGDLTACQVVDLNSGPQATAVSCDTIKCTLWDNVRLFMVQSGVNVQLWFGICKYEGVVLFHFNGSYFIYSANC